MLRVASTLAAAGLALSACTIWEPYPYPPPRPPRPALEGPLGFAVTYVDAIGNDLTEKQKSTDRIRTATSLATLGGFAGAALSAVAGAGNSTILGFSGAGAGGLVANGLFGSTTQSKIYRAGSVAIACINNSIDQVVNAHLNLARYEKAIRSGWEKVKEDLVRPPAPGDQNVSDDQKTEATALMDSAKSAVAALTSRLEQDDDYASQIVAAANGVLQAVSTQLDNNLPDAAAMARAGASLSSATLSAQDAAKQSGAALARSNVTPQGAAGGNAQLAQDLAKLSADITAANAITGTDFHYPAITCTVATVTVAAIGIAGAQNGVTTLIQGGPEATYTVTGGTGGYFKPTTFSGDNSGNASGIVIKFDAPNLLTLQAPSTVKPDTYKLPITDTSGSQGSVTVVVKTKSTDQPPGQPGGPQLGASSLTFQQNQKPLLLVPLTQGGQAATFDIVGGTPSFTATYTSTPGGTPPQPVVSGTQVTVTVDALSPTGSFVLTVKDNTGLTGTISVRVTAANATPTAAPLTLKAQDGGAPPSPVEIALNASATLAIEGGSGSFEVSSNLTTSDGSTELQGALLTISIKSAAKPGLYAVTVNDKKTAALKPLSFSVQVP